MNPEQGTEETAPRPSELQFHLWSSDITEGDKDVRWITGQLKPDPNLRVLDVGGGNGQFASILANWAQCHVDVLDPSEVAALHFTKSARCRLIKADFNSWDDRAVPRYDLVIFRLVLHHLIDGDDRRSLRNQSAGLAKAASLLSESGRIYIVENIYDPWIGDDLSARLIFEATRLKRPAAAFRKLGANTAGEGVRFHSLKAWRRLLSANGLTVETEGFDYLWAQPFPLYQRVAFLCARRHQWLSIARPI